MKKYLILLVGVMANAHSESLWPILNEPRIDRCGNGPQGQCSSGVYYTNSGIWMVPVSPVRPPNPSLGVNVVAQGIHCTTGSAIDGRLPFKDCEWRERHAPEMTGKCTLQSTMSWELTPDSTCAVSSKGGEHIGAGPGGECVVFVQGRKQITSQGVMTTPWGDLSAEQVANSGNRFCSKPLPPHVTCNISLPNVIDHGVVRPGEVSKRDDEGVIDCGTSPKFDVLVDGDTDENGVKISVVPTLLSRTQIRITSEVDISPAAGAGQYSATYVFVVSPY